MSVEQVVLLTPDGTPCGVADKASVHGEVTPYHLAFSCYVFDRAGRLLVTRRALDKQTWPGVWTNSCCGHPGPGEEPADAVVRRLAQELGLVPARLTLALPEFSYRASFGGVEEFELCPVFLAEAGGELTLDPDEVAEARWEPWDEFAVAAAAAESTISPWAQEQVRALLAGGHVARFLTDTHEED
ncbi:MAG TPA: isopentenyl-diphosphate Delta-isomerase [Sporichthya sp.]|nr:isopentenyl-diphosphate Delta-isomerase [Sporichthya sp.]